MHQVLFECIFRYLDGRLMGKCLEHPELANVASTGPIRVTGQLKRFVQLLLETVSDKPPDNGKRKSPFPGGVFQFTVVTKAQDSLTQLPRSGFLEPEKCREPKR